MLIKGRIVEIKRLMDTDDESGDIVCKGLQGVIEDNGGYCTGFSCETDDMCFKIKTRFDRDCIFQMSHDPEFDSNIIIDLEEIEDQDVFETNVLKYAKELSSKIKINFVS